MITLNQKFFFLELPLLAVLLTVGVSYFKKIKGEDVCLLWCGLYISLCLVSTFFYHLMKFNQIKVTMQHWWEATGWVWAIGLPVAGLIVYFSARAMDTDGD